MSRNEKSSSEKGDDGEGVAHLEPGGEIELGRRIRALRQARGWTQQELAERAGLTKRTIGSYERLGPPPSRMGLLDAVFDGDLSAISVSSLAAQVDELAVRLAAVEQCLNQDPGRDLERAR